MYLFFCHVLFSSLQVTQNLVQVIKIISQVLSTTTITEGMYCNIHVVIPFLFLTLIFVCRRTLGDCRRQALPTSSDSVFFFFFSFPETRQALVQMLHTVRQRSPQEFDSVLETLCPEHVSDLNDALVRYSQ